MCTYILGGIDGATLTFTARLVVRKAFFKWFFLYLLFYSGNYNCGVCYSCTPCSKLLVLELSTNSIA